MKMTNTVRNHGTELIVAWVVAAGVIGAGIYDFRQGKAPSGLLDIDSDSRFVLFIASCLLSALAASWMAISEQNHNRPWMRGVVLALSIAPGVLADPTYGSLLLAVPLISIRRNDDEPTRTLGTLAVVGIITWLVLSEDTPRVVAEIEAIFSLAIAFFIIVMFGDALRRLDQSLLAETELAQLTERTRLATDLHDSVGHHLLACSIQLRKAQALQTRDAEAASVAVGFASQAVAEAISETRLLVDATRNDQSLQLAPAVRDLVKRVVPASTDVRLDLAADLEHIDPAVHVALYRVTQEALSNLVRHASATEVALATSVGDNMISLVIADNGTGFDISTPNKPGGLTNMRKRIEGLGGTFELESSQDGTTIRATVST